MIVGIGHRKRVGKDTFAGLLAKSLENLGFEVLQEGFADKLKDVCNQIYGWAGIERADFYDRFPAEREKRNPILGMTPREPWIKFGTNAVRREVYDDTWLDYLLMQQGRCDVLIIPDVRFRNEFNRIRSDGGILIKVSRLSAPKSTDIADCNLDDETTWDYVVHNEGDMAGLEATARAIAGDIGRAIVKEVNEGVSVSGHFRESSTGHEVSDK